MDIKNLISDSASCNVSLQVSSKQLQEFADHIIERTLAKVQADEAAPAAEKLLTIDEVAEMLSVSRVTLWSWRRKGILEAVRVGNLLRYRKSDIEELMAGK